MSRLRADEVLSKDANGPFLATEGMNVAVGKNINFNDASEPTLLNGTSLTTTTINVDEINLSNNQKINLGISQDLQLYHDGQNSYIDDAGSGNLRLRSGTLQVYNLAGTKTSAVFNAGGGQELYFDDVKHFETDTNGVNIVGNIASTHFSAASTGLTSTYLSTTAAGLTSDFLTTSATGLTSDFLTTSATGTAITGTTTSTSGWAGTTSSAGVLGGLAMAFSCGINGRIGFPAVNATMVFGGSEFQGGTDNTEGVVMPYAGKVYAATVHSENQIQSLRLALSINGDTTNTTNTLIMNGSSSAQNFSVVEDWSASPVSFNAGDRVNFRVLYTNVTQLEVVTVTFFTKFD